MSALEPLPWVVRFLTGRGLRVPEEVPPGDLPGGWAEWFALAGYTVGVDYSPLGDPAPEGNRLNLVFTRLGQDVATIDLHHVHSDGSDTVPFTDADRDNVTTHALQLWTDIKSFYDVDIALDRLIFHDFGVDIAVPNPARRTTIVGPFAGTATEEFLPPQVAASVTFKTDRRRSWGRVYMPAPKITAMGADGYFSTAFADALRDAFGTYGDSCITDHLPMVVWAPRHAGELLKYSSVRPRPSTFTADIPDTTSVARSVDVIQVDNIADVIRSRRNVHPSHVATHTF